MEILYNSDNYTTATQKLRAEFNSEIESELKRFKSHLTRVHVHISDTNGGKNSPNDKQCILEVNVNGMKNIAATGIGNSLNLALRGSLEKLTAALDSAIGKANHH